MLVEVLHLVLSEIHSSLTSSFSRGITLITSPPRVLTMMLLPTASSTSMDSVFLQMQQMKKLRLRGSTSHWREVQTELQTNLPGCCGGRPCPTWSPMAER